MKTHHWAGVTLCLKNLFGTLPGIYYGWPKNLLHFRGIERSILDLARTVKVHYNVIDGVVGMEGDGPIMGKAKPVGVLVLSPFSLAADATAARLMGFDPRRVLYLVQAGAVPSRAEAGGRRSPGRGPAEVRDAVRLPGRFQADAGRPLLLARDLATSVAAVRKMIAARLTADPQMKLAGQIAQDDLVLSGGDDKRPWPRDWPRRLRLSCRRSRPASRGRNCPGRRRPRAGRVSRGSVPGPGSPPCS